MDESDVRLRISHALQWHGCWPKHNQDGRTIGGVLFTPEVKGLPDLETRHPKFPNEMIEVKAVRRYDKAFVLTQIEIEQREYLDSWTEAGGNGYLAVGKIVPMGSKSKIHSIFVFPWTLWKLIEANYQKSIPYSWDLYEKKPSGWESIRDLKSFMDTKYGMYQDPKMGWSFPASHPLAIPPLVDVPYYKKVRANANAVPKSIQIPGTDQPGNASQPVQ